MWSRQLTEFCASIVLARQCAVRFAVELASGVRCFHRLVFLKSVSVARTFTQHIAVCVFRVYPFRENTRRRCTSYMELCTDILRLTAGIPSEKRVVMRFLRCANVYLHKPR